MLLNGWYNELMDRKEAKKRIEKLKETISHHRYLYHVLDKQEISDAALDSLKKELSFLEKKYPEFLTKDSPTQRVGGQPLEKFEKVKHQIPMLSMEDVFSEEEIKNWEDYLKRLLRIEKIEYFSELKIDGFAVNLAYKKGVFVQGSTRGNGKIGEDVTGNLKTIGSIPLKIEIKGKLPKELESKIEKIIKEGEIEIRGEVYMEKDGFRKINEKLEKEGEKKYANPRNLAAGSIRQLDPKLAASRPLKFLAYDIVTDLGQKKHSQEHKILPSLGFKTNEGKVCKNLNEVFNYWEFVTKGRKSYPFQIDGVVVMVNDNKLFKKLGIAGRGSRAARALKFSPEEATTIVKDIILQVGRTGAVTPVAILKPVKVGGTTITRATLHNEDEIKRLGVKIGDTVIVARAGDVIPDIVKVLKDLRTGKEKNFHFKKKCPMCGGDLVRKEGEAVWRCINPNCSAVKSKYLHYFVSKKAFDIEGLGPKLVDKLMDENLVSEAPDIFKLAQGDLIPLERLAEKSASNIIKSIEKSKKISFPAFIRALGVRYVGEETSIDLALHFGNLQRLKEASLEELESVPDIGEVVAKSLFNWFRKEKNISFIKDLLDLGIKITFSKGIKKKLKNKKFVFTGTLENLVRDEAKNRVRMLGGEVSSSVSKETDFVVCGNSPGSKKEKAEKLGVKIVSEEEFLKIIRE
jgi:DNA ligase (NAD+)